jgi:hypothetical protein
MLAPRHALAAAVLLLLPARIVHASGCVAPADLAAVAAVRALVAQQCDCATALSPGVYRRCASAVATVAVTQGRLSPECLSTVRRCASKAVCGRPGAVACCRTTASGHKKCTIKRTAATCRAPSGGSACVSDAPSCCDACGAGGGCATTTTTAAATTTTSPVATTTTTTAAGGSSTTTTEPTATCGDGVREPGEACDCGPFGCDFGGVTCPGTSGGGAFLDCVDTCTRVDTSHCPGATTTSTSASTTRPPTSTTGAVTTTTGASTTTTSTTLAPVVCTDPLLALPPLLNVPLQTVAGSSACGGPAFSPPASSPFVGSVRDAAGHALASLGTDCLYAGGGAAAVPGLALPTGTETVVSVVGLRGSKAVLGPSDGSGPATCTRAAGPGRHCIDGRPGTDGHGTCTADASCSGTPGSCALDANCFFAPPLAVANVLPGVDACAVSTALADFCGDLDILSFATDVRGALSTRIYLAACPTCTSGRCSAGPRSGQSCQASSAGTSVDCPPDASPFVGAFAADITLSSEASVLASSTGAFCPGQTSLGAFGLPAARRVETAGVRPNLLTLQATLAGPFCGGATGNALVDATLGLPAPVAVGAKARVNLFDLLRLFGR